VNWLQDPTAFAIYVLLVGLVVGALALRSFARGMDSRGWPVAEAWITSSSLEQDSDGGYFVRVSYEYTVGSTMHTRREHLTTSWPLTKGNATRLLAAYPIGATVDVRYKPSRPTHAVLRPGVRWGTWVWMVIAFGTLLLGVGLLQGWIVAGS
jgi:Protein of unknown function (DUF3592)